MGPKPRKPAPNHFSSPAGAPEKGPHIAGRRTGPGTMVWTTADPRYLDRTTVKHIRPLCRELDR